MNSSLHHNYAAHAGEAGIVTGGPTGPSGSGIEPGNSHHGGAYYPDDGSAFWHIHHNVAEDLNGGEWLFAWNPNDQHDLTVTENFVDTDVFLCASKTWPVLRLFPPCALVLDAQGSSGVVDNMPSAWRGHTKSLTTWARPSPDLAVWLE